MKVFAIRCTITSDGDGNSLIFGHAGHYVARKREVEAVCDLDEFGTLIGIEILDFKYNSGIKNVQFSAGQMQGSPCQITYSEASDALYIKLKESRSRDQQAVIAILECSSDGDLISLRLNKCFKC